MRHVADEPHLKRVSSSEIDWNERKPYDAGGVHGEADKFGLEKKRNV
jgi:hypothetical protein